MCQFPSNTGATGFLWFLYHDDDLKLPRGLPIPSPLNRHPSDMTSTEQSGVEALGCMARRLARRNLVEEFCLLGIEPLSPMSGWGLELSAIVPKVVRSGCDFLHGPPREGALPYWCTIIFV